MTPADICLSAAFIAAILVAVKFASDVRRTASRERESRVASAVVALAQQQESGNPNRTLPKRLHWSE